MDISKIFNNSAAITVNTNNIPRIDFLKDIKTEDLIVIARDMYEKFKAKLRKNISNAKLEAILKFIREKKLKNEERNEQMKQIILQHYEYKCNHIENLIKSYKRRKSILIRRNILDVISHLSVINAWAIEVKFKKKNLKFLFLDTRIKIDFTFKSSSNIIRKIIRLTTKSMSETMNEISEIIYDGVNASPYDDPVYKTEMAFRYSNYNTETNTFRVDLYTGLGKTEPKELQPYEWEHFDDKEQYERTDHTKKEKWILTTAKEIVSKYKGYPDHVKDWGEVNKSKYEEYDFNEAELWIDYNERCVCIRLYCPKTRLDFLEYLNLDDLEVDYYEEVESDFLYNVKGVKEDIMYYFDEYAKECAEDFIERVKIDEEEEGKEFNQELSILSFIELMKAGFTDWLMEEDKDYEPL